MCLGSLCPVSILYKSIAVRYRPVRVADGPTTARYSFIKNASWVVVCMCSVVYFMNQVFLCILELTLTALSKTEADDSLFNFISDCFQ